MHLHQGHLLRAVQIPEHPCVICGGYGNGTAVDYQAGMEATLTTLLPFSLTEVNEVWCYPGILAGFACGSFHKAILSEEMMRYSNRMLQGVQMAVNLELPGQLAAGVREGSFLSLGSMAAYRRDNYVSKIFNKWGIAQASDVGKTDLAHKVQRVLESRIAAYQLPERSAAQKKLLQPYLPSQCQDQRCQL